MNVGRLLIFVGLLLVVFGVIVLALNRFNLPFGRLPGDIVWRRQNTTVYFPWLSCLLLSVFGSLLLWLLARRS